MIITTRITLKDLWEKNAKEECLSTVGASRRMQYENQMREHILPELGGLEVRMISTEDINRLLTGRMASCNAGRKNSIKAILYKVFHIAVRLGIRADNPVENAVHIKTYRAEAFRYSEEYCVQLLKAFSSSELSGAFVFQFLTGLSRAEVYGLRASGLDIASRIITIDQFYRTDGHVVHICSSHINYRSRKVTITECAMNVLLRELEKREKRRAKKGGTWKNEYDLVFTDHDGGPVTYNMALRELRKVKRCCRYEGAGSLQDNFGVMAADLGVSTVDLHEYLGHKSYYSAARCQMSRGNIRDPEDIDAFYTGMMSR